VIVTDVPTAPVVGERLVMLGAATTVKLTPLLALFETVTTTFPVVAPDGTVATILLALQLVAVAVAPLNLTVLVPWVEPKFDPVIVTKAPTAPEVGDKLVMLGGAACASVAKIDTSESPRLRIRIGFQLLKRMNATLRGFSGATDEAGFLATTDNDKNQLTADRKQ